MVGHDDSVFLSILFYLLRIISFGSPMLRRFGSSYPPARRLDEDVLPIAKTAAAPTPPPEEEDSVATIALDARIIKPAIPTIIMTIVAESTIKRGRLGEDVVVFSLLIAPIVDVALSSDVFVIFNFITNLT